jgi:hypothetical protein
VNRFALLLGVCSLCLGCATVGESGNVRVHHFLFGLAGGAAVDVRDVCRSGRAESVSVHRGVSAYLLSIVTLGLYLPHDVQIRCAKGPRR